MNNFQNIKLPESFYANLSLRTDWRGKHFTSGGVGKKPAEPPRFCHFEVGVAMSFRAEVRRTGAEGSVFTVRPLDCRSR